MQASTGFQPALALVAGESLGKALARLGDALARVHAFYDAIGGLPGYQRRCLQMIAAGRAAAAASAAAADRSSADPGDGRAAPRVGKHEGPGRSERGDLQGDLRGDPAQGDGGMRFHLPRGPDLAGPDGRALAAAAAAAGLEALPHMAEIYPIGGAHPQHGAPGAF